MFCFVSLNFSLMLALLQLDNVEHVRQFVFFFFSFSFASTFNDIPCQSKHVSLYFRCVKKSREYRRCWCTCMHVGELEHHDAFLCPGERLHSVTAAHTRWLSKESQVVVPSAAQSSVDAAHADICLRWLLRGEEKSAFPYACARRNPSLHPLLPPHCPLLPISPPPPPPPPVSARWLPEHCLPWVTVPDAVCVHRHPHSIHFIPSFLCFSLSSSAGLSSRTQVALCWFLCLSNTTTSRHAHLHTLIPTQLSLLLNCPYLRKCLFSHLLSLTPKLQKYTDFFSFFFFPSIRPWPFLIPSCFPCIVCDDIWELPYGCILKLKIGLQMLPAQRARCI